MSPYSRRQQVLAAVGWLLLVGLAAAIGAAASVDAAGFYSQLILPSWAPPAAVFGPVWSVLYLLMALAAWLAWREGPQAGQRTALVLFAAQLALNALWSWLFFGWRLGALALADVLLLWLLVAATLMMFWRQRRLAGLLLLPYRPGSASPQP
jgi:benzodiazapine receptor